MARGKGEWRGQAAQPDATSAPSLLLPLPLLLHLRCGAKAGTQPSQVKLFLSWRCLLQRTAHRPKMQIRCKARTSRKVMPPLPLPFPRPPCNCAHTWRLMGATRAISKKCLKFVVRNSAGKSASRSHTHTISRLPPSHTSPPPLPAESQKGST